jgi:hypothetical protein
MKSILDRSFRYIPSAQTDLKKTFARARREQRLLQHARAHAGAEPAGKVLSIGRRKSTEVLLKEVLTVKS